MAQNLSTISDILALIDDHKSSLNDSDYLRYCSLLMRFYKHCAVNDIERKEIVKYTRGSLIDEYNCVYGLFRYRRYQKYKTTFIYEGDTCINSYKILVPNDNFIVKQHIYSKNQLIYLADIIKNKLSKSENSLTKSFSFMKKDEISSWILDNNRILLLD
tara:strand:+ start:70 stop:546 length:477 start_codon:yes stop_codon:yes gene_type:complete